MQSVPDDPTQFPSVSWELGTAYDFFISLHVLHQPENFGLRASWAAGVRSRLSPDDRQVLEVTSELFLVPLNWIHNLPEPRDSAAALRALQQIPPEQRLPMLALHPGMRPEVLDMLLRVAKRASWSEADLELFRDVYRQERHEMLRPKRSAELLDIWARAGEFGECYFAALQSYSQAFFAEEEQRILPALQEGLALAQALAQDYPLPALFEQLSQGVQIHDLLAKDALIFVPSYWSTPLVFFRKLDERRSLVTFGVRPADASLVPGEMIPDALLQGLKAVSDATRLRILRYLMRQPQTPTELARRLRLRAPTVIHHLNALRLAGLVHLTLGAQDEKLYAARQEAIAGLHAQLTNFLENRFDEENE